VLAVSGILFLHTARCCIAYAPALLALPAPVQDTGLELERMREWWCPEKYTIKRGVRARSLQPGRGVPCG
jgi:hypothetical protein